MKMLVNRHSFVKKVKRWIWMRWQIREFQYHYLRHEIEEKSGRLRQRYYLAYPGRYRSRWTQCRAYAPEQRRYARENSIGLIKGSKSRQIFDLTMHVLDDRWYSKTELAEAMGLPNNKSFGTYISALSKIVASREYGSIRLFDLI